MLDAAASLFAARGIDGVSLRDIAEAADVHPDLIRRYIGTRSELVLAVFNDLSAQLAVVVADNPLSGQGLGPETVMGKWVRVASALVVSGQPLVATEASIRCWPWPAPSRMPTGSIPWQPVCVRPRSSPPHWGGGYSRTTSSRQESSGGPPRRVAGGAGPFGPSPRRDAMAVSAGPSIPPGLTPSARDLRP